ncbi:MAG TPA: squalene--hopene cyclase [Rhodanobacteraceae bacterium]
MRDISGGEAVATGGHPTPNPLGTGRLETAIAAAREALLHAQHANGHWCHELEADCTIPAEYILMLRYFGESEPEIETKIGNYLRARQGDDNGWPLYQGGAMDISCSVKAYYALKLIGDDPESEHMRRARQAILARGGAARANVFTRMALALFGELPWRGVPVVPVEFVLLPRWFPVHLSKISYWSRTVVTPLSVLCSLKPCAANPQDIHIRELFATPPEDEKHYFAPAQNWLARLLLWSDRPAHFLDRHAPRWLRRRALKRAEAWILQRLNGIDGLGAIFPAMVNACEALALMGHGPDSPALRKALDSVRALLVVHGDEAYCQPCVSPVWDTGLSCLALQMDARGRPASEVEHALSQALPWLHAKQLLDEGGDWKINHPRLEGGGWAFQYCNDCYPDLDDTAVMAWTLDQAEEGDRYAESITRAANWLVGMQSRNGGFAAFDANNTHYWLNQIPFADHGALLDPPTSDVSARVLTLLAKLDRPGDAKVRQRALAYLRGEQTADGSWFGRWGTNYIYGTWSVLMAMEAAGVAHDDPAVRHAVAWLERCQREDGGWGETNDTYVDPELAGTDTRGNAAQTAWALLGLMASGEGRSDAVARGVAWLLRTQDPDGRWYDAGFNAPGFPRVFYLKYHGYSHYFPYWALARYRLEMAATHA